MPGISREEVLHIAALAKLKLSEEEIQLYQQQLSKILQYMERLQEVDTSQVAPLSHVHDVENQWREDVVEPSMPREAALKNAPEHDAAFFIVPRVIKE